MVAKFVRARDEDRSLRAPGIGVTSREEKKKKVKTRQSPHQKQRQEEDGQLLYNWEKGTHHSIILYAAKVCHKHKANKDFFPYIKKLEVFITNLHCKTLKEILQAEWKGSHAEMWI